MDNSILPDSVAAKDRLRELSVIGVNFLPKIMQLILKDIISPKGLKAKFKKRDLNVAFTEDEHSLMSKLPNTDDFTVLLCYKLLRYGNFIDEPKCKWGSFPEEKHVEIADDVLRILQIRNVLIKKLHEGVTNDYYKETKRHMDSIIDRVDLYLDSGNTECRELYKSVCESMDDASSCLKILEKLSVESTMSLDTGKHQMRLHCARLSMLVIEVLPNILRCIIMKSNVRVSAEDIYIKCTTILHRFETFQKKMLVTLHSTNTYDSLDIPLLCKLIRLFFLDLKILPPTQGWWTKPPPTAQHLGDDVERINILRNELAHLSSVDINKALFEDYFAHIEYISRRIDHQFGTTFAQLIIDRKTEDIDYDKQILYQNLLRELENVQCRYEKKPIKFYWGDTFETNLRNIRSNLNDALEEGKKKIRLKIVLKYEKDRDEAVRILNELPEEINRGLKRIEFIMASPGSIELHVEGPIGMFITDEELMTNLYSLMNNVLQLGVFAISPNEAIDVHLIFEEEYTKQSTMMFDTKETNDTSEIIIDFNVEASVFETEDLLTETLGNAVKAIMQHGNGNCGNTEISATILPLDIEQNKITSSDEALVSDGKCEVLKTEEEYTKQSAIQVNGASFIDHNIDDIFDTEDKRNTYDSSDFEATDEETEIYAKVPHLQLGDPHVPLMITLLTNLYKLNNHEKVSLVTETTPKADLGRIPYYTCYMNQILHNKDVKIKNTFVSMAQEDIIEAVGRLVGLDECKELKTKNLEESTVPWNIREQNSSILETWKMNYSTFVETRATKHVLKCVQENSCVTITASAGVGKTATLQRVALKMADKGYSILIVLNIQDIVTFYNPNQKTLFVMDDFCGTYSIDQSEPNCQVSVMERLKQLIENKLTKIVVACRLQVYQDKKFESLSIFRTCVCNLLSEDLCLSQTEKRSIANLYLETKAIEIMQYCDLYDCFPLICKLYNDNPELNIIDFFKNPFSIYEFEIDKLQKTRNHKKYCALALCVMFNNRLKEEWFTEDVSKDIKKIIENTCEACRLKADTPPLILIDELKTLEHSFIKKEQGVYKTLHDKLFEFLSFYFGKKIIHCLIKYGNYLVIMQRFLLEETHDMDQFITVVPPKYHEMYIQRLVDDLATGRVNCVFINLNMKVPEFRQRFLCYLKQLDIQTQRQLAQTRDVNTKCTTLIQCCYLGDIPLTQWCIDHGVEVNPCKPTDLVPMYISAKEGHTDVVKLLLDTKADINRCADNGASPFNIACANNHIEVVKLLLDNKADIEKCNNYEASPLYLACQNNNLETTKILLDYTVDINKSTDNGSSPLYVACQKNHIEIVKVLLENKANINQCRYNEASPLYVACKNDHIEVVKTLLDNNADVNKCRNNGSSPLNVACYYNHTEVVKVLLANKADINKCNNEGSSPLFNACQNNYLETVKELLDNNADLNICDDNEASPLYIACQNNHIEVVKALVEKKLDINKGRNNGSSPLNVACYYNYMQVVKVLLANKADINNSDNNGATPLFNACQNNHIETVKEVLDKNTNINKCDVNGASPLYIACQNNHIQIVKMLMDNNADIIKCTNDGASPLNVACCNNHIEVVKILLANKADPNKCDDKGTTPLYIACQNNNKETVKVLLDSKADVNKCANNGVSPMNVACYNQHTEIVKLLLDNKADIDKCDSNGVSPLFVACQNNNIETVKVLLDNKADINKCTNDGGSPLLVACQHNHVETVKVLLDNKADINKCNDNGVSPLFLVCRNNHIQTLKVLLDNKADIDKCYDNGASPLHIASYSNHKETVQILLDSKANINKSDIHGASPLYFACQSNHIETVKVLLENKADINKCRYNGSSPLYVACQYNYVRIVKVLLDSNADINKSDANGFSPFNMACYRNHKETIKVLLDKADINSSNNHGASGLYNACQQNHIETVKILLDNKADVNKCNDDGVSPLFVACSRNHIEIVKVLLDNKAKIDKCDDNGASPLHIACYSNHKETVKILLDSKANINKSGIHGASPLYFACQNNHIKIVKVLLANKAHINKSCDNGASPLFTSCRDNHIEVVQVLVDNNANIEQCKVNGASPLYIACKNNRIEIVKVLLDNKANINKCRDNGASPLKIACSYNNIEVVKQLIESKADVNKCANNGESPLFIACMNNHKDIVKNLLDNSADIHHCTYFKSSPLFVAFMRNHHEIVKMLEERGVGCNREKSRILAWIINSIHSTKDSK